MCTHKDILSVVNGVGDLVSQITLWGLEIVPGISSVVHEGQVSVVGDVEELVVPSRDVGHVHVVGGGTDVLVLPVGEDVEGDHVDLGVAVLAGLGSGHLHDLAGASL